MKKWIMFVIVIALGLAGCGGNAQDQGGGNENGAEAKGIGVNKGRSNVEITLPASLFEVQDIDQAIEEAKEKGVTKAVKNGDGSVTYTMPKSAHDQMMKEMADGITDFIKELKAGEDFKSVQDVTHNKGFNEFALTVKKEQYENSFDGFAVFGLALQGMFYQAFNGVKEDKLKVTIQLKDADTNKVFDTVTYPDDMNLE